MPIHTSPNLSEVARFKGISDNGFQLCWSEFCVVENRAIRVKSANNAVNAIVDVTKTLFVLCELSDEGVVVDFGDKCQASIG